MPLRTSLRTNLAALAATGALALGTGVLAAPPAAASDQTFYGCLSGDACIYGAGAALSTGPTNSFRRAGTYNLSGQNNWHYVKNNQTGGWKFRLCTGWNGTGTCYTMAQDELWWVDLTPINSVVVTP
ncbi:MULTISPECIES: hypothetical protein [Streptomyces]|uniref:hypothetical protein n=1 Tax=Streptomyces TaxID=1883 RepID=UPI000C18776A|nr:hypothetical protein [Streptomyces sp. 2132.2]